MKIINLSLIEGDITMRIPLPISKESFDMLIDMIKIQKAAWVKDPIQEDYQI